MGKTKKYTLILGVGNPLRRDDGIGSAAVESLNRIRTSNEGNCGNHQDVDIIDGGTDGLGLIEYLKDYKKVIIIDAVQMRLPPGTLKIFTPKEALISIKSDALSTHGFGIAELIKLAGALDITPEFTIIGIQPEDTGYGEGLSKTVNSTLGHLVETVCTIISENI